MTNTETTICEAFAHLEDDRESASRYLSIFIDESLQTLDELTEALLALEAGGGRESMEQLFVAAHRIKGSAASIGLNRAAKLAHLMEDLLQILVDDGRTLAPELADGLLACTDGLRRYVDALKDGRSEEDHFDALAQRLWEAQSSCGAIPPAAAEAQTEISPAPAQECGGDGATLKGEEAGAKAAHREDRSGIDEELRRCVFIALGDQDHDNVLIGKIVFEPDLPLVGLKARLIVSKLSNLGSICYFDPPLGNIDNLDEIGSLCFGVATERPPEEVRRLLHVAGVQAMAVESLERRETPAKASALGIPNALEPNAKPAETLRVDIERLDRLMNLAGQLAIGKRAAQIAEKLKKTVVGEESARVLNRVTAELKKMAGGAATGEGGTGDRAEAAQLRHTARRLQAQLETVHREAETLAEARACIHDLFETIHLLDSVSDGIRQNVMDMRMLPIGPLFSRFHRVIRDITRANGKDIHLAIGGEKTELDKRMIDELGDPMIHLIRNAADHGIEAPDVRAAAGKPPQGTISLEACHRGSNIAIRVSDDGKGLDADRLRAKAVEKGLVTAADAEQMTRQQIYQLIWLPGLSTADKVTDVSGRGVGMDIVRSKIRELSGTVEVESEPGRGTAFTIKLPLTLAILPSLMVEIDSDVFAVPLESVLEIVHVGRRDMNTVHGHWTAAIRDRVVAILTLGAVFQWGRRDNGADAGESDDLTLVIIGEGQRQLGLAVDRVLGEEDVVIKSIAENYRNLAGIAGASILGDGRISLILDPPTLIAMSSHPIANAADFQEKIL